MKTKILSGLMCCLGIFSANAQTITAPAGQALTVTNSIDVTNPGGSVNVPSDGSYNFGGTKIISIKGTNNFFLGANAGPVNTATNNIFIGANTGQFNTSGYNNLFLGSNAGFSNVSGFANTFMGESSGLLNISGINNMFLGAAAGAGNQIGNSNTFIGVNAGRFSTADGNAFIGAASGYSTTSGGGNAGFGSGSGYSNTTGAQNLFLGVNAGYNNTTGSNNVFIGNGANTSSGSLTNAIAIGSNAIATTSNSIVLGSGSTTITGAGLAANNSGLKFANLTSASTPVGPASGGKVLSVDGSGNVVLVSTGLGVNTVVGPLEITSVLPGSGLKFTNLTSASLPVNPSFTGGKVLSVDLLGNVILVSLNGATTNAVGNPVAESWKESDGYLYNNSTNGVVIKGTGLDGNSLIVKGGVLSKEVNVKVEGSEAWPDYVFKSNYKRMSLGDVEKFIAINGHLPNVPSATEMAISGNNLGKTDVKLLEKVEELTLYLLDMKKVNDAQAAQLKSLKQQVNKLRKK